MLMLLGLQIIAAYPTTCPVFVPFHNISAGDGEFTSSWGQLWSLGSPFLERAKVLLLGLVLPIQAVQSTCSLSRTSRHWKGVCSSGPESSPFLQPLPWVCLEPSAAEAAIPECAHTLFSWSVTNTACDSVVLSRTWRRGSYLPQLRLNNSLIKKWAETINRHFYKENIQLANR